MNQGLSSYISYFILCVVWIMAFTGSIVLRESHPAISLIGFACVLFHVYCDIREREKK